MKTRRRGLPLLALVTAVLALLIVASTAIVGGSAYRSASHNADRLWRDVAWNLGDRATHRTLSYLEPGKPFTGYLLGPRPMHEIVGAHRIKLRSLRGEWGGLVVSQKVGHAKASVFCMLQHDILSNR